MEENPRDPSHLQVLFFFIKKKKKKKKEKKKRKKKVFFLLNANERKFFYFIFLIVANERKLLLQSWCLVMEYCPCNYVPYVMYGMFVKLSVTLTFITMVWSDEEWVRRIIMRLSLPNHYLISCCITFHLACLFFMSASTLWKNCHKNWLIPLTVFFFHI